MTIPLYMSGTIVCVYTSSPKQQQLEDFHKIILTYQHDWDPHSVRFPKCSHSEEEKDLFAVIAEIRVDALLSEVHETHIWPGIRKTVHDLSFNAT